MGTEYTILISQKIRQMPTRLTDCCAFPFLWFAKIYPMPSVLSFWLQEAPVVLVIQPFAAEMQTHNLIWMIGSHLSSPGKLLTASFGRLLYIPGGRRMCQRMVLAYSCVHPSPTTPQRFILACGLSTTATGPLVTSRHSEDWHPLANAV